MSNQAKSKNMDLSAWRLNPQTPMHGLPFSLQTAKKCKNWDMQKQEGWWQVAEEKCACGHGQGVVMDYWARPEGVKLSGASLPHCLWEVLP